MTAVVKDAHGRDVGINIAVTADGIEISDAVFMDRRQDDDLEALKESYPFLLEQYKQQMIKTAQEMNETLFI